MLTQLAHTLRQQAAHGETPSPEQLRAAAHALDELAAATMALALALMLSRREAGQPHRPDLEKLANDALRCARYTGQPAAVPA